MGRINVTKPSPNHSPLASTLPPGAHLNWMGGPSYDVRSPLVRLRIAAASCFFGEPTYYQVDAADPRPKPAEADRRCANRTKS